MIIDGEPFLIEYNVRMGDPECQTILPKLKTDFNKVIKACVEKNLNTLDLEWDDEKSLCVVLCAKGYPDKYGNEILIENIENLKLDEDDYFFHAGTKKINDKVYSNGGRVINFVSLSSNFKNSRDKAISLIKNLNWKDGFYRKDIGHKVIDE